jgi:hypothetical protein
MPTFDAKAHRQDSFDQLKQLVNKKDRMVGLAFGVARA